MSDIKRHPIKFFEPDSKTPGEMLFAIADLDALNLPPTALAIIEAINAQAVKSKKHLFLEGSLIYNLLFELSGHQVYKPAKQDFDLMTDLTAEELREIKPWGATFWGETVDGLLQFDSTKSATLSSKERPFKIDITCNLFLADFLAIFYNARGKDFNICTFIARIKDHQLQIFDVVRGAAIYDFSHDLIRTVDSASKSFLQDPKRLLRLAKLQTFIPHLTVDHEISLAITELANDLEALAAITNLPEKDMFLAKYFFSGHGREYFQTLVTTKIWPMFFPALIYLPSSDEAKETTQPSESDQYYIQLPSQTLNLIAERLERVDQAVISGHSFTTHEIYWLYAIIIATIQQALLPEETSDELLRANTQILMQEWGLLRQPNLESLQPSLETQELIAKETDAKIDLMLTHIKKIKDGSWFKQLAQPPSPRTSPPAKKTPSPTLSPPLSNVTEIKIVTALPPSPPTVDEDKSSTASSATASPKNNAQPNTITLHAQLTQALQSAIPVTHSVVSDSRASSEQKDDSKEQKLKKSESKEASPLTSSAEHSAEAKKITTEIATRSAVISSASSTAISAMSSGSLGSSQPTQRAETIIIYPHQGGPRIEMDLKTATAQFGEDVIPREEKERAQSIQHQRVLCYYPNIRPPQWRTMAESDAKAELNLRFSQIQVPTVAKQEILVTYTSKNGSSETVKLPIELVLHALRSNAPQFIELPDLHTTIFIRHDVFVTAYLAMMEALEKNSSALAVMNFKVANSYNIPSQQWQLALSHHANTADPQALAMYEIFKKHKKYHFINEQLINYLNIITNTVSHVFMRWKQEDSHPPIFSVLTSKDIANILADYFISHGINAQIERAEQLNCYRLKLVNPTFDKLHRIIFEEIILEKFQMLQAFEKKLDEKKEEKHEENDTENSDAPRESLCDRITKWFT